MRIFLTFMLLFATVLTQAQEKSIVSDLDNLKLKIGESYTPSTYVCLLYTSPSPRDKRQSRMPSSA